MARSLISRIADNIPVAGIATSAQRAVRRLGRGGPGISPEDQQDPNQPTPESRQSQLAKTIATKTIFTALQGIGCFVSLPVLIIILFVALSCFGALMALVSVTGLGHGTNANAPTVIAQLEERNCIIAEGCTADEARAILCEEYKREIVDPETGETTEVSSSEDCERILEESNSTSTTTSAGAS